MTGILPLQRRAQKGFTLVELVSVIVILALLSAVGSGFFVRAVDGYRTTQLRSDLMQRGRLVLEQMARQLRQAVPNSVRLNASGSCIEFMPVVAVASYLGQLPDTQNGMASASSVAVFPYDVNLGEIKHVIVAPFNPIEVYANGLPAARVGFGGSAGNPVSAISFIAAHRFMRNSLSNRLFLAGDPQRFCIVGTQLLQYSGYSLLTSALDDADPGGNSAIMATDVAALGSAFQLSPGSEDRNSSVQINLQFSAGRNSIRLNHQVLIRNVP